MVERIVHSTVGRPGACIGQAPSLWTVAAGGCKPVCEIAGPKRPHETRRKPSRGGAWLRDDMVSDTKQITLRVIRPLSRNTLRSCGVVAHGSTGQWTNRTRVTGWEGCVGSGGDWSAVGLRGGQPNRTLLSVQEAAERGMGNEICHLHHLAESQFVNLGDLCWDVKVSDRPMTSAGVGAAIVVGGWESQPQGEGPQLVGLSGMQM
jgi:hypothetical protein